MKATSFLDMVTLLSATAESDKEIDDKLSKLILLYNKPPRNLCDIFSNLYQLEICKDDYFDTADNTLHFDDNIFTLIYKKKQYIHKAPKNINELITAVNSTNISFRLEFRQSLVNEIGFNPIFKDLISIYDL